MDNRKEVSILDLFPPEKRDSVKAVAKDYAFKKRTDQLLKAVPTTTPKEPKEIDFTKPENNPLINNDDVITRNPVFDDDNCDHIHIDNPLINNY